MPPINDWVNVAALRQSYPSSVQNLSKRRMVQLIGRQVKKPTASLSSVLSQSGKKLDRPTYPEKTVIRRRMAAGIAANASSTLGQVTQCSRKIRSSKYHITGRLTSTAVTTPGHIGEGEGRGPRDKSRSGAWQTQNRSSHRFPRLACRRECSNTLHRRQNRQKRSCNTNSAARRATPKTCVL